jgi:hypothetical protein
MTGRFRPKADPQIARQSVVLSCDVEHQHSANGTASERTFN